MGKTPGKGPPAPLDNVIQFHAQRAIFTMEKSDEIMPRDHEVFSKLKDKKYFVDSDVSWWKSAVGHVVAKLALKMIG